MQFRLCLPFPSRWKEDWKLINSLLCRYPCFILLDEKRIESISSGSGSGTLVLMSSMKRGLKVQMSLGSASYFNLILDEKRIERVTGAAGVLYLPNNLSMKRGLKVYCNQLFSKSNFTVSMKRGLKGIYINVACF